MPPVKENALPCPYRRGHSKTKKVIGPFKPVGYIFKIITQLNLRHLKTENRQHQVKLLYKNNENGKQLI